MSVWGWIIVALVIVGGIGFIICIAQDGGIDGDGTDMGN
jgi:hypothetical protein